MNTICMWIPPGSVPALYLGAGVGSGVLVLLVLLIGGVLKCLQSKRGRALLCQFIVTLNHVQFYIKSMIPG